MHCRRLFLGIISVALIVPPVSAQITNEELLTATQVLQWREIGPTIMSGRISDIAVVEANPSIFYLGTATGESGRLRMQARLSSHFFREKRLPLSVM